MGGCKPKKLCENLKRKENEIYKDFLFTFFFYIQNVSKLLD